MMTKKNKPTTSQQGGDECLETGIFKRIISRRPRSVQEVNEVMQRETGWIYQSIQENLERIRKELRPLIEPFLYKIEDIQVELEQYAPGLRATLPLHAYQPFTIDMPNRGTSLPLLPDLRVLDIGDGTCCYRVSSKLNDRSLTAEVARDALQALYELNDILVSIGKSQQFLFVATLELGRLLERISVRPFEPVAAIGKKIREASLERNRKSVEIRSKKAQVDYARYQREVNERMATKGIVYSQAIVEVAEANDVSTETVRKNTKNKSPRNQGGGGKKGRKSTR